MSETQLPRLTAITFARDLRWEAALRRADRSAMIFAVDSLGGLRLRQAADAGSIAVVAALECEPSELCDFLRTHREGSSRGLVMLVGDASLETLRWQLIECGADLVLTSERQFATAVHNLRQRFVRRLAPDTTMRERVWSRLPWGDLPSEPASRQITSR